MNASIRQASKWMAAASVAALALMGCRKEDPQAIVEKPSQPWPIVVSTPSQAGVVAGSDQNSDEFIWRLLAKVMAPAKASAPSPAVFETWATDSDMFPAPGKTPVWPAMERPKKFQKSILLSMKESPHARALIDVKCSAPGNAAVGGFPTTGTPTPCIAEETTRNRPQFDYISANNLYSQKGLAAAYAKNFQVAMPTDSVSVKGDWVPVKTLLQWLPFLDSVENIRKYYHTSVSDGVEYAVIAMHISSRQNPNWVWGTVEHQFNPGRCDEIGCLDSFGAVQSIVRPNRQTLNAQYGECKKSTALQAIFDEAKLPKVWENYCLKSSQVDFTAADGTPYVLGNSSIERIFGNGVVGASSCITCHYYASFGKNGQVQAQARNMLPYNPSGQPIPSVLNNMRQFDFMWGVFAAQ